MTVIFLDTETTGLDVEEAELIELAVGELQSNSLLNLESGLYKPKKPIPYSAMEINNITNDMVSLAPTLDVDSVESLVDMLRISDPTTIYVSHTKFDRLILEFNLARVDRNLSNVVKERWKDNWICTYRLARHVLQDDETCEKFSLNYLKYFLHLNLENIVAHRATDDVVVCYEIYNKLVDMAIAKNMINDKSIEQVMELTQSPIPMETFMFGKRHSGKKLVDVPTDYFMWMIKNTDILDIDSHNYDPDLSDAIDSEIMRRQEL